MDNTNPQPDNLTDGQSVSYKQALIESVPLIVLLLAITVVGYLYVPTGWWVVVFVFGAVSAFTNRLYYQKSMNLRERLRNR